MFKVNTFLGLPKLVQNLYKYDVLDLEKSKKSERKNVGVYRDIYRTL